MTAPVLIFDPDATAQPGPPPNEPPAAESVLLRRCHGMEGTTAELAAAAGIKRDTAQRALRSMWRRGWIKRVARWPHVWRFDGCA